MVSHSHTHCVSLCITVYHCISLCITVYHCVSLCIIVYHCASLCITVHHCASLCITVYHCASLCITVYHCVSLCIMIAAYVLVVHFSPFQAFSNPRHPLGILMNRLEMVYHTSYGGIGANKYLLPHAIAETHSLIKRIHTIVRYGGTNWNTHNGDYCRKKLVQWLSHMQLSFCQSKGCIWLLHRKSKSLN